ncbi:MAG TPA: hypothetical protein PLQ45_02945, partial [Anaerohalosphaeraceae bacterium]|nr:hypothetical protein [Anaerohalosphaeraceae bacterium]
YSIKISGYELRLDRFLSASAADSGLPWLADGLSWHKSGSKRRAGGTKWRADGSYWLTAARRVQRKTSKFHTLPAFSAPNRGKQMKKYFSALRMPHSLAPSWFIKTCPRRYRLSAPIELIIDSL